MSCCISVEPLSKEEQRCETVGSICNSVEIQAVEWQHGSNSPWRACFLLLLMNRSLQLEIILSNKLFHFGSLHYESVLYHYILKVVFNFRYLFPKSMNSSSDLHCIPNPLLGKKTPQKFLHSCQTLCRNQWEVHQLPLFLFLQLLLNINFHVWLANISSGRFLMEDF